MAASLALNMTILRSTAQGAVQVSRAEGGFGQTQAGGGGKDMFLPAPGPPGSRTQRVRISSMRRLTSSVSLTPAAFTVSSICPTLVAPVITLLTPG